MNISATNSIDPAAWERFAANHPHASIYHHPLWLSVLQDTYGYRPFYHVVVGTDGMYQAALVSAYVSSPFTGRRLVSLPFSDMCDPLVETEKQLSALMKSLDITRRSLHARFAEFRFFRAIPHLDPEVFSHEYCLHRLYLDKPIEQIFRSFHKNCIQRAIKKAQKENIEIFQGRHLADLKAFYRLHLITRKKHGVPVQPFRFFRNLWETFYPRQMTTLLMARFEGNVIAAVILLWHNKTAYYKFGASDDRFQNQRANQLLMWEAIQIAHNRNCKCFDFGRTSITNRGLEKYKSRWGTKKHPLDYFQLPPSKKAGMLTETTALHSHLKRMMVNMPTCINRVGSELLYKHLG